MGTRGVRGELRVMPYNPDSFLFSERTTVYIRIGPQETPFTIRKAKPGPKGFFLELDGVNDRETAKNLYGSELLFPREGFPELDEGEVYLVDLIGFSVLDADHGENYGKVEDVLDNGAQDCLIVKKGKRELLIPVVDEIVLEIDDQEGAVIVRLPEGLLEIYEN